MFLVQPRTETVPETLRRRAPDGTPMRVVHHLSFPDEAAARDAAEIAEMLGWSLEALGAQPSPFPGWLLRVSQDTVLVAETLDVARGVLEGLARGGAGSYGGWEARPARRHLVRVAS